MESKMRSVWQTQQEVTYCLYGSKRNMMLNIFNSSNSPFYRFGQVVFMQKIKKEDWIPFILSSFKKTWKEITEQQAAGICDITECHSWYLQQFCFFLWNLTSDVVSKETFDTALKQVININTPMFQNDMENLTSSQKELLRAVSSGQKRLTSASTLETYHLGNPNTINKNKKILRNKDILELHDDGTLDFIDTIFKLWLSSQGKSGNLLWK